MVLTCPMAIPRNRYARLYPEYQFIFFGDNGQGDVYAAEMMLDKASVRRYAQSEKDGRCPVSAILIHDVHDDRGASIRGQMLVHGVVTGDLESMQALAEPDSIFAQTQRRLNEIAHDHEEA